MSFNVSEFSSQVNRHGLAVSNLFVLNITPPGGLQLDISPRDLPFFCRAVDLPDMAITALENKPYSVGALQSYPIAMNNDQVPCIFMLDQRMNILKFFEKWMQLIYNYDVSGGPMSAVNGLNPYEINYKRDYIGTIEVYIYSSHSPTDVHKVTYSDAFPISVTMPQLDWNNAAEVSTTTVNFRYSSVKYEGAITGSVDSSYAYTGINFGNNTYGSLLGSNSIPDFIKDLRNVKKLVNETGDFLNRLF